MTKKNMVMLVVLTFGTLQAWAANVADEVDWQSAKDIQNHISIILDPKKGEVVTAPNYALADPALSDDFSEIRLVRIVDTENKEYYRLEITALYQDKNWRNYQKAHVNSGGELKLIPVSKAENICDDQQVCRYREKFIVNLGFVHVVDSITNGFDITLTGSKVLQIHMSGKYFLAIMRTIN